MRNSIARAEVEFSGCAAFEFKDLTAKFWSMKLKKYSFNVRDDDEQDRMNMLRNYGKGLFSVKGL